MSEEHNVEVKEEKCNCLCHSKGFRKFLVIATGTFVGVYCALCLFTAIHRPPMPAPCPCGCPMMRPPVAHPADFARMDKGPRGDFHKKMIKHKTDKEPLRVEIEEE